MTGSPEVLKCLVASLAQEFHLNLQCRLDSKTLKNSGVKKLAKKLYCFADEAHTFYCKLINRIEFLGGDPTCTIGQIVRRTGVTEILSASLSAEMAIVTPMEDYAILAFNAKDDGTRNLFEHLIKWHQCQIKWIETQLRLIEALGEDEYIAEKL